MLGGLQRNLHQSFMQIASGLRINRASDDAAGMAVAGGLRADIHIMGQTMRNTNDSLSMLQTADGALATIGGSLIRLQELSTQARNGVLTDDQRGILDKEFQSIVQGISQTTGIATFNGTAVLRTDGSGNVLAGTVNLDLTALSGATLSDPDAAASAVAQASQSMTSARASVGMTRKSLEEALEMLGDRSSSMATSHSRLMDADLAAGAAQLTHQMLLFKAAASVLVKANSLQSSVLDLLG
jgi:flagellin